MKYYAIANNLAIAGGYSDLEQLICDVKRHYQEQMPITIINENGGIEKLLEKDKPKPYVACLPISITVTETQFFFRQPYRYRINS